MTNDSKTRSRQRYSQFAAGYVSSHTHATGADLERLVELAAPQADWRILDIATGGGHTALKFAPYVEEVVASDLTPAMLEKAEEHLRSKGVQNVRFQVADAEDLPFADETFHLVTCRIAPHHFSNVGQFLRESRRVLKTGGRLLLQDHVLPDEVVTAAVVDGFEALRDPSHNMAFSQDQWINLFQAARFQVEHTEQLTKRHDFRTWAERQGCTQETIAQLVAMVNRSTEAVRAWMQPQHWGTPQASFVNHHIIVAGRKPAGR